VFVPVDPSEGVVRTVFSDSLTSQPPRPRRVSSQRAKAAQRRICARVTVDWLAGLEPVLASRGKRAPVCTTVVGCRTWIKPGQRPRIDPLHRGALLLEQRSVQSQNTTSAAPAGFPPTATSAAPATRSLTCFSSRAPTCSKSRSFRRQLHPRLIVATWRRTAVADPPSGRSCRRSCRGPPFRRADHSQRLPPSSGSESSSSPHLLGVPRLDVGSGGVLARFTPLKCAAPKYLPPYRVSPTMTPNGTV